MTRKLVLFDIDGTILLTAGAGRRAIVAALAEEVGDHAGVRSAIRFDGKTDPQIVAELLEAAGQPEPRETAPRARAVRALRRLPGPRARAPHHPDDRHARRPPLCSSGSRRSRRGARPPDRQPRARARRSSSAPAASTPERFRVGAYGSDAAHRPDLPPIAARRAEPIFGRVPARRRGRHHRRKKTSFLFTHTGST